MSPKWSFSELAPFCLIGEEESAGVCVQGQQDGRLTHVTNVLSQLM